MPDRSVWSRISALISRTCRGEESALVPGGHRPDHILAGQIKRPNGYVLSILDLNNDPGAQGVLPGGIELDSSPRHDQLVGGDVGFGQRLADCFGLRGSCAIDRIRQSVETSEGTGGITVEIRLESLQKDVIDLFNQRIARGEIQRPDLA